MTCLDEPRVRAHRQRLLLLLGLGLILVALVFGYWKSLAFLLGPDYRLDLGSINFPTQRLKVVWNAYSLWGSIAAILLFIALPKAMPARWTAVIARHPNSGVAVFAAVNVLAACLVQVFILNHAPLTDDESAYRFAAATLRSGQLSLPAPTFSEFLSRQFLVIGDHIFAAYFLGWPALLAAAGILGIEQWTAAAFTGLSIIPLTLILRRYCEPPLVVAGLIIYSASFMVQVMGATLLAHAATTFFLLAFIESYHALRETKKPTARLGALCALFFCVTFFIRPATALGIGAPFLLAMAAMLSTRRREVLPAFVGFGTVSAFGAALFFYVNHAAYGGYLNTGYSCYIDYMRDTGREVFGPNNPPIADRLRAVLTTPALAGELIKASVQRLSFDFFGWPIPVYLVALLAVWRDRRLWLFVTSALSTIIVHGLILDLGIDSFGPVHLFESGVLLVILVSAGAQALCRKPLVERTSLLMKLRLPDLSATNCLRGILALTLTAWLFYFPVRAINLTRIADDVLEPLSAAEKIEGRLIVFVRGGITSNQVAIRPLRHFVFFMPINDPDFNNRILWMQDLGAEANARVLERMPDRTGFGLRWDGIGNPVLLPLGP